MMTASFLEQPPVRTEVEYWIWEPALQPIPAWNRPLARLLNRPETTWPAALTWLDWICEEDRPRIREAVERHLNAPGESPLLLQFRIQTEDGRSMHILGQGMVTDRLADGRAQRLAGSFVNTTRQVQTQTAYQNLLQRQALALDGINAGFWEWDIATNEEYWSPRLYQLLGYEPGEIPATYDSFLHVLLHPEDRQRVLDAVAAHFDQRDLFRLDVRLRMRSGAFRWFETAGQCARDAAGAPRRMSGSIIDIDQKKNTRLELEKREFLLREAGDMAHIGGWELLLEGPTLWWSDEVRRIHEVPLTYQPELSEALRFYAEPCRSIIDQAVQECIQAQRPWNIELQLNTARKRRIWVRTIGKPLLDDRGRVVGLRGVIQDIDQQKKRELSLQKSLNLIRDQNARLYSFAHIISHNLRSHTGNIELMLDLLRETTTLPTEQADLLDKLQAISGQLNQTIVHLNQVVTIRTSLDLSRQPVRFATVLAEVRAALAQELAVTGAEVRADFAGAPELEYVAEYLSNMLKELLSNALRYHHPERTPVVCFVATREKGRVILRVSDNGLGIDLRQHGAKLFGLYNTFHAHPQARGFGLFLIRNYVESLGGRIEAASTPGEGTTFTLIF
jgi:PAS domain S-box-containing protein